MEDKAWGFGIWRTFSHQISSDFWKQYNQIGEELGEDFLGTDGFSGIQVHSKTQRVIFHSFALMKAESMLPGKLWAQATQYQFFSFSFSFQHPGFSNRKTDITFFEVPKTVSILSSCFSTVNLWFHFFSPKLVPNPDQVWKFIQQFVPMAPWLWLSWKTSCAAAASAPKTRKPRRWRPKWHCSRNERPKTWFLYGLRLVKLLRSRIDNCGIIILLYVIYHWCLDFIF